MSPRAFSVETPIEPGITLLEASAGTGKTYQITTIALRLLVEQGIPVRELLVVTFTRAATAELRERIRGRVTAAARAFVEGVAPHDDDVVAWLYERAVARGETDVWRDRLVAARESFDQLTISTIHGFCQRMRDQNAFESGAAFGEELVDDDRALIEDVVDDYISAFINTATPQRYAGLRRAPAFRRDALVWLARLAVGNPDAEVAPAPVDIDEATARRDYGVALEQVRAARDDIATTYELAHRKGQVLSRNKEHTRPRVEAMLDELEGALAQACDAECPWSGSLAFISLDTFTPGGKGGAAFEVPPALVEIFERIGRHADDVSLARAQFVNWVRAAVDARHAQQRTQTFDHLVRGLAEALRDPARREAVREAIGARYRAALIDEFQDTDAAQWEIFSTCFGDDRHRLVLIGDPKQAIYRFRGADVNVYLQARDAADAAYTMDRNYRSDGAYVAALNHVYAADPWGAATVFGGRADGRGITYPPVRWREGRDPAARLRWADERPASGLSLRWLPPEVIRPGRKAARRSNKGETQGALVPRVAEDVVEMLGSGAQRHVDDAWRPLGPGDVAVLVRDRFQADEIREALVERGVPAVIAGAGNVFHAEEARALELWMAAVASPGDERAARAAAVTPLFGWTGEQLLEVEREQAEWLQRWTDWLDALTRARLTFIERGFMAALRGCMAEFGVVERVLGTAGGARRLTNVLHLAELIHAACTTDRLRLAGALRWLHQRRADDTFDRETAELRLEGDEDAVRVVTVHASKGLQYPVVFLPFAWTDEVKSPQGDAAFLVGDRRRPGARVLDVHVAATRPERLAHLGTQRREALEEGARLLYVALTRAESRCVVYDAPARALADSPLATLLHGRVEGGGDIDRIAAASARVAEATASSLRGDLEALAESASGEASVALSICTPLPAEPGRYVPVDASRAPALRARDFERYGIDTVWGRSSFTGLVRAASRPPGDKGASAGALQDERTAGRDHDAIVAAALDTEGAGARDVEPLPEPPRRSGPSVEVPLASFPAGARQGTFLHAVYEHADFRWADGEEANLTPLDAVIEREAQLSGIELHVDDWGARLGPALVATLRTPLGGPLETFRLCDLPRARRLDELEFDLPVAGGHRHRARTGPVLDAAPVRPPRQVGAQLSLDLGVEVPPPSSGGRRRGASSRRSQGPTATARSPRGGVGTTRVAHPRVRDREFIEAMRSDPEGCGMPASYLESLGTLSFGEIAGYLTGSIDLVFAAPVPGETQLRWWVADYKSNRLDLRRDGQVGIDNYCPAWMSREMAHHHYYVQLHLYALALHRYLGVRLADYDYGRDFGGVYYLFVRGMVGPETPVAADGQRYGCRFLRPSRKIIEALDELFRREPGTGAA